MRPIPLGLARVPTLLRPRTGALHRGDPPTSLTQYYWQKGAGWQAGGFAFKERQLR